MKKLLAFTLSLLMIAALAACGESTAPAASEPASTPPAASTPAAPDPAPSGEDSPDSTAAATPTATNTGLPDGYKLEVEQTGEKSGIVRLTDPNLQESYATSDSSVEEKKALYSWIVTLGDTYEIYMGLYNGVFTDVETMPLEEMAYSLRHSNDRSNEVSRPSLYVDGKTLVWEIDLSDANDFSWSNVKDYKITIIDAPKSVKIDVTIPLEGATQTPYIPSTPAPASVPDSSSASPTPVGGTIPMPDGFPSNPGDAEYFKPLTDDYILQAHANLYSTNSYGDCYLLISYDANGSIVQFKAKIIYNSPDEIQTTNYSEQFDSRDYSSYITVNGNIIYIDYLAMDGSYSQNGYFSGEDAHRQNRATWDQMPSSRSVYEDNKAIYSGDNYYVSKP